ncbi:MAG: AAA family ATPase [Candidatus Sedimenticola sp. 20ELBAFRAG]
MYETFYGFKEKPFSLLPDPGFLYFGKKHTIAFSMLEYAMMNHAGFTVLTGEVGSGKTTLLRHLLNKLDPRLTVGLVSNTHQDMGELLQWLLMAFDQPYKGMGKVELYEAFYDFLLGEYSNKRDVVLIIDEAQNLSADTLEELRLVSNINMGKHMVLQVVLVGQPELRDKLKSPQLLQFSQRILVDYHLQPLSERETLEYINHRMKVVGRSTQVFTPEAMAMVFHASGGVPRIINILCETALVYGYAEKQLIIDHALMRDVIQDKHDSGMLQGLQTLPDTLSLVK